jgi:hypothetical protein
MRRRWLGAALLTLLGACAHQPQLIDRPDRVWASSKGLEAAASCVIGVLDERGRMESNISPNLTHARRVIEPGKVYEIRPEQESVVSSETYIVRLEKIDDRITRMSLYARSPWKKQMIRALSPCGARS